MGPDGPAVKTTDDIFKGKKVVLFAVPGAFTPTCNNNHLPGFLKNADAFKGKGVDTIAVTGVNDVFVFDAWKKSTGAGGKIEFLADGNGDFAKALDLALGRLGHRARHPLQALRHAGRGRRGEKAQRRGRARQGGDLERGQSAEADVMNPPLAGDAKTGTGPLDLLDSGRRRSRLRRGGVRAVQVWLPAMLAC